MIPKTIPEEWRKLMVQELDGHPHFDRIESFHFALIHDVTWFKKTWKRKRYRTDGKRKVSQYYKEFMRTFKGNKKSIGCAICNKSFDSLKELKKHKEDDHSY